MRIYVTTEMIDHLLRAGGDVLIIYMFSVQPRRGWTAAPLS